MLRPLRDTFPLVLPLIGCSGGDAALSAGSSALGPPVTTYVAFARDNGIASITRGDRAFDSEFLLINDAQGGVELDYFGNAFQADIGQAGGSIQVLWRIRERSNKDGTAVFTSTLDRSIAGAATTLVEPREVALAHGAGLLFVTDTSDATIKVWGMAAGGDAPPLFVTSPAAAAWDVAYDEPNDRLYASLIDGTVAVYDAFVASRPAAPARTIIPSLDGLVPAGTSFRGLLYVAEGGADRLLVADVGAVEGAALDGAIHQVDGASTADGLTPVIGTLTATLADPMDLVFESDGGLRVADAGSDRAVYFPPGFVPVSTALPAIPEPSLLQSMPQPRGLAIEPVQPDVAVTSVSDVDDPATPIDGLLVSLRPMSTNGGIQRFPADLSTGSTATFDIGAAVSTATVDAMGDVYAGYSDGTNGGLAVVSRLAQSRGTGIDTAFDASRDRLLTIEPGVFFPVPTPVDPQGVDLEESQGVVLIADRGYPGVWLFGQPVGPAGAEALLLEDGFSASSLPMGLDYDGQSDRLFVAVSNGAVYVYDSFLEAPGTAPDRIITPSGALGATQASESLRAVVHDAERDLLILADAGAVAGTSNDGAIFVIEGASMASGLTPVTATLRGNTTQLDEPLDLAWNGATLWIAEQQNGLLLRYDDFLMVEGDVAATASASVPSVRSVELILSGLAPTAGGSIDLD